MKNIRSKVKQANSITRRYIPNRHLALVGTLSLVLVAVTLLPSRPADAKRHSVRISLPSPTEKPLQSPIDSNFNQPSLTKVKKVKKVTIKSGDSLSSLFHKVGLSNTDMMNFLQQSGQKKKLRRLYPGDELYFFIENSEILRLEYHESKLEGYAIQRNNDKTYSLETLKKEPDVFLAHTAGTITNSLYNAGIKAKLNDRLIMELANIFGWDIDFALDLRKGDTFKVVYEEQFLDGEKLKNGNIVAAEFTNQGETYTALRYTHKNGKVGYYTPKGESMQKAFLRAPVDFRRISSSFNPRRLHPVFKTIRPHRGIDYAADRGTPVWASGNGRVIASGYSKANGNYVFIQHGNNIQTKYLHLHKRLVKKGHKVKQKQRIGTVGSTGYSTAPHLHYEFLMSGVHRNPRTILNKLPKAKSIAKSEMALFKNKTSYYHQELTTTTNIARLD